MTAKGFALAGTALEPPPPPGRLSVIVTYLAMDRPPSGEPLPRPKGDLAIVRANPPTVSFYRYLYAAVGERWLWHEQRRKPDRELERVITSPDVEVWVLHASGTPAGYAQIDRGQIDREKAGAADVAYFGLVPEFIGRGFGPWFLDWTIRRAWAGATKKVTVNTCTFDHPKALPLYLSMGFAPVRHVRREIDDPRVNGPLPRSAGPHIPIIE